jgi:FimV-like protein
MHVLLGTIFVVLLGVQAAWAVSFGKIDVASKMGEPFYAEVPLRLSDTESLKKTSVELGNPADYRILEVFRNPVVNTIRTDIVDDERGVRVTLSSDAAIDEAFFSLILKVRYGRSTHYKKFPVFLDPPSATVVSADKAKPLPAVDAANTDPTLSTAFVDKTPEGAKPASKEAFEDIDENEAETETIDQGFTPYDGWARTSRYGPMVYGDTITTVAQRLRVDDRFTNQQVMVALFEKNKAKFSKNNINLIKAGSYLDVPSAQEVSQISPSQAKQILSEQTKAWRAMQRDPKYAALAEAQRNRYAKRVRIGQTATGTARQPMATSGGAISGSSAGAGTLKDKPSAMAMEGKAAMPSAQAGVAVKELEKKLAQKDAAFTALQEKMAALEAKLAQANKAAGVAGGANQNAASAASSDQYATSTDATAAALEAQNKRLELMITRLKSQLDAAKANANSTDSSSMADWLWYALIALAALVLALLVAVFMLMRKGREHPAEKEAMLEALADMDASEDEASAEDLDATKLMDADEFDMPTDLGESSDEADASAELFGGVDDLEEIPELTDEETGEMEPFNPDDDETPDPNVNYLEDADVYMRYGMEDEAEAQVRMALKLQEDNPEAHAKMVQILRAKGDDEAVNNAISAAKVALTGSALALFETAISGEDSVAEQSSDDAILEDLPSENVAEAADDIDIGSLDFEENADVALAEEDEKGTDSDIDFDFSDMAESTDNKDEREGAAEDAGEALPDLDIDITDIADLDLNDAKEAEEDVVAEAHGEAENSISGELDEVEGISEEEVLEFTDSLKDEDDALDFGDFDLGETAEVQLDAGTLLVSADGDGIEDQDGLNDFEIDKAKAAAEAEKNATAVDIDPDSEDPFAAAKAALDEKDKDQASVDWDVDSVGTLTGEEEDPLSLTDEKAEDIADDGTAEVELEDLDFDLPNLDADETKADVGEASEDKTVSDEEAAVELDADADVSLDDLDMDFDLPDIDAEEEGKDDSDSTFIMDAGDTSEDKTTSDEEAAVELDADTDVSLDDLDMDFDLPDIDVEEEAKDDSDSTFIMDAGDSSEDKTASDEEAAVDLDVALEASDGDDDFELMDFEGEDIESIDAGMDDLDISTTTVDPVRLGYTDAEDSSESGDEEVDMLADLDADLSELEMHEESIISDVDKLGVGDEGGDTTSGKDALSDDDLDKTFILNDVAKNKAMLEEGAEKEKESHFANLDDALEGASSVSDDDPMVDGFSSTEELDGIHETIDSIESLKESDNDPMVETFGASKELDDLMKDLDGLLDEDKDKK